MEPMQSHHELESHHEEAAISEGLLHMRKSRSTRCERVSDVNRIPLRKYEEITLEGRIVELMNNLKQGRDCSSDLQRIFKRLGKIKPKEVMNRYILSGLLTLQRLLPMSALSDHTVFLGELSEHIQSIRAQAVEILNSTEDMHEELIEDYDESAEGSDPRLTIKVLSTRFRIRNETSFELFTTSSR